jgi:methionyl-tRNA formyltransferase
VTSLRLAFAGTPVFSALHLKPLVDSEHQLIGVYTQPDRPAGRGKKLQPSPVKQLALEAGLPVYQPATLKSEEARAQLAELAVDALVVVAYGLILPQPILDTPRLGCINVHASLLPRWRGAAPIQRAIAAGDTVTGTTIMRMDAGLDTGDMLASAEVAIGPDTTAATLHDELAAIGAPLLLKVLADLPRHLARGRPQDDAGATYAHKIDKAEAAVDWSRDAAELDRLVRAFNPFPVCFSGLAGQRVRIWSARPAGNAPLQDPPGTILRADADGILVNCGRGQLLIQRLQLSGGKPLAAREVLNGAGHLLAPGARFESPA